MKSSRYFVFNHSVLLCPNLYSINLQNSLRTCCILVLVLSTALHSSKSESESYVTTDGQSASLSWNKAPTWGLRPDSYYRRTVAGLLMWGALSDERTGLSLTTAAGPSQRSHSRVRAPRDPRPHFTDSSKLQQILVICAPQEPHRKPTETTHWRAECCPATSYSSRLTFACMHRGVFIEPLHCFEQIRYHTTGSGRGLI
jgi:hypothetical protein